MENTKTKHNLSVRSKDSASGITLIALVITIIVLLILAGVAISMLSGENGILRQAAEAKEKTEKSGLEEQIKLAILSARVNGNGDINYSKLNEELVELGFDRGEKENNDNYINDIKRLPSVVKLNEKYYAISEDGTVKIAKWHYERDSENQNRRTIVTDGTVKLHLGDYVNYDSTKGDKEGTEEKKVVKTYSSPAGTSIENSYSKADPNAIQGSGFNDFEQSYTNIEYNKGWKVLGIDESTGEILLISADAVYSTEEDYFYLEGFTGYRYGVDELNNISEIFGNGYGATGARSVTVDDINKITGYNPNNAGVYDPYQTNNSGEKYGQDYLWEYGTKVTYYWDGSNYPYYVGPNSETGNLIQDPTYYKNCGFNYFENGKWKSSAYSTTASTNNKEKITQITSTRYAYYADSLTNNAMSEGDTVTGISSTSKEYKMLFFDSTGSSTSYWLASPDVMNNSLIVSFGYNYVTNKGRVQSIGIYQADGRVFENSHLVRPVVSLKWDAILSETSEGSEEWNID